MLNFTSANTFLLSTYAYATVYAISKGAQKVFQLVKNRFATSHSKANTLIEEAEIRHKNHFAQYNERCEELMRTRGRVETGSDQNFNLVVLEPTHDITLEERLLSILHRFPISRHLSAAIVTGTAYFLGRQIATATGAMDGTLTASLDESLGVASVTGFGSAIIDEAFSNIYLPGKALLNRKKTIDELEAKDNRLVSLKKNI